MDTNEGNVAAQFDQGFKYYYGQGVPQDYAEAAKWYRKAADQDYAEAQHLLGLMYASGSGVPQDYVESHKWLSLAARRLRPSIKDRDEIASKMTPSQIAEAQISVRDWTGSGILDTVVPPPTVQISSDMAAQAKAIRGADAPLQESSNVAAASQTGSTKGSGISGVQANALLFVIVLVVLGGVIYLNSQSSVPIGPIPDKPIAQSNGETANSALPPPTTSPIVGSSESPSVPPTAAPKVAIQPSAASPSLSQTEMHHCAAEAIRIKAAKEMADSRSKEQMRAINSHQRRYEQLCESNGNPPALSSDVIAFASAYRSNFEVEGRQWVVKALRNPLPAAGQSDVRSPRGGVSVDTASQEVRETHPSPEVASALPQRRQITAPQFRNLVDAVLRGTALDVRRMLDDGADVNSRSDGTMPLISAARLGNVEIAEILIERGADLERSDNQGFTAMKWAKQAGDGPMVKLLERAGAKNPYAQSGAR